MTLELFAKSDDALKTIREVADLLGVAPSALRFWEEQFPEIRPLKLKGNRRYYRPIDIAALQRVKALLYEQGYTIKRAKAKRMMAKRESDSMGEDNQNLIDRDLLGDAKKVRKPRTKKAALELANLQLVIPRALTLDEQKRVDLEKIKADLQAMQDIIRPYL